MLQAQFYHQSVLEGEDDPAIQEHLAAERRFLGAAAKRAERGELSLTRLDYATAAEHFRSASERVL